MPIFIIGVKSYIGLSSTGSARSPIVLVEFGRIAQASLLGIEWLLMKTYSSLLGDHFRFMNMVAKRHTAAAIRVQTSLKIIENLRCVE